MLPQAWTLDYQTRKEFEDEKISREVENQTIFDICDAHGINVFSHKIFGGGMNVLDKVERRLGPLNMNSRHI